MSLTKDDKEFIHLLIQGVNARIDSSHEILRLQNEETISLARKTNGRVTQLETWRTEHKTRDEGREKMNGALKWVVVVMLGIITMLFGNNIIGKKEPKPLLLQKVDSNTVIYFRGGEMQKLDSVYWNDADNPAPTR